MSSEEVTTTEQLSEGHKSLRRLDKIIKAISWILVLTIVAFGGYYYYQQHQMSKQSFESKAILEAREIIKKSPRNADARVRLGVLYLQDNRSEQAIEQFEQALKVTKDNQEALLYLGITYLKQEDYDKALSYFDKEIKYYKNTAYALTNSYLEQAYYYGGVAHWKTKEPNKALEYLNKALEIKRTSADTYLVIGRIQLDKKDYDAAVTAFGNAVKFDAHYADALYGRGLAYEKKGDKKEALENYEAALKEKPDFALAKEAVKRVKR